MATKKTAARADEARLKMHIKTEALLPVYLLFGEETYLTARYVEQLVEKALKDDPMRDFNLTRLDGQTCESNEILAAAETLPMMAERRVVVVRNWNVEKAYYSPDVLKKDLSDFFADPPAECVLIFRLSGKLSDFLPKDDKYKSTSPKWTAFCDLIAKRGMVVEINARPEGENARALSAMAARRNVKMEPATARVLIDRVGNDLARLVNETEKLCAATETGEITPDLVRALTAESLESRIFDLSKAIAANQADRVYRILRGLEFHREEPSKVLSVLAGSFVDYYRVRVALDGGLPTRWVITTFHYEKREFVIDHALQTVRNRSTACIRRCLDLLSQANDRLKSTSIEPWQLLEQVSVELMRELQRRDN